MKCIIAWAKTVYSPLRSDGVAHRSYMRQCAIAIPIHVFIVDSKTKDSGLCI